MSETDNKIKLFNQQQIRSEWDVFSSRRDLSSVENGRKRVSASRRDATRWFNARRNFFHKPPHLPSLRDGHSCLVCFLPSFHPYGMTILTVSKAAKAAREQIEKSTGKPAVSRLNAKDLGQKSLKMANC